MSCLWHAIMYTVNIMSVLLANVLYYFDQMNRLAVGYMKCCNCSCNADRSAFLSHLLSLSWL